MYVWATLFRPVFSGRGWWALFYLPLCPVGALKGYVRATSHRSPSRLFVWPDSLVPLSRRHISKLLCAVIEEADPGSAPEGHDVSGYVCFSGIPQTLFTRQDGIKA